MDNKLVIHPNHYNQVDRKECWEEMIDIFGPDAVAIFDVLNAYKYFYRAGFKEGNSEEQDLAKINNYMNHSSNLISINLNYTSNIDMAQDCYKAMKKILKENSNG